ncbi:MAG: AMP-binding protein [Pseudomonadota bacterium]
MAETRTGQHLDLADDHPATLLEALRRARRRHGSTMEIVRDGEGARLDYGELLTSVYALGRRLGGLPAPAGRLGILLPTSAPALVAFFAAHAANRVPVLLNFTADPATLRASCRTARIETVLTSRRFLRAAGLQASADALERCATLVHLEDLRQEVGLVDKLVAALRTRFSFLAPDHAAADDPAVILFTSGTTGEPKGVALSHANLLANMEQLRQHVPFDPAWVFFDAMPMFHSLGLTGGALLPVLSGMKTVLHPSPLDKNRIAKLIEETGANVLVATDTFARLYARSASEDALRGLRFLVLGGERVRDTTRDLLAQKTSAVIVEGYGVTECAPVVTLNQPDANRAGTVGRLLPGIEARLEPVEDIDVGRRLLVRGPNVMLGYLDPDQDSAIARRGNDWFDTGDLVDIDEDGFVRMTGRVKRFAKVGAEMVSLEAIEAEADALWAEAHHAAVVVEGADGGEQIVLVTDQPGAERSDYAAWAREHDIARVTIPDHVLVVDEVPLTATGQPRYEAVRRTARERLASGGQANRASGSSPSVRST